MPKRYDIQKAKWKKAEDVCLPRGEGRASDIVIPYVLLEIIEMSIAEVYVWSVSWALLESERVPCALQIFGVLAEQTHSHSVSSLTTS